MKLDMELVRDILLWIEENQVTPRAEIDDIPIAGKTDVEIGYHVALLCQAGFLDASLEEVTGTDGEDYLIYTVRTIWMTGHDLLDNLRSKSALDEAVALAASAGKGGLISVYKALQDSAVAAMIAYAAARIRGT
ncbi:hypothetical protein JCM7686_2939 [Paracoccus aminophilus JCM 7686]|uniref:DUF2513 domain-containing protein n=2 Tax=Paracoccus aminophilus TaxID=34003 RepID=S5XRE7_PARAH|nr:hypothetical protein JCM7686_2939 [Paracoccus aminophilus JCM 7686]